MLRGAFYLADDTNSVIKRIWVQLYSQSIPYLGASDAVQLNLGIKEIFVVHDQILSWLQFGYLIHVDALDMLLGVREDHIV